jgi:Ser-tRNA(Ala) deacylase AlaX
MAFEVWVLIPVAAIIMGGIKDMMKVKANQRQLGASTTELEREVAELRKRNALLTDRVESIEAIVVSQTWDAVHAPHATETERDLRIASVAHRELAPPDPAEVNQQRLQQLAQRLGR